MEHPVVVIEGLLRLNMGDEGRLLYLRKAITNGQIIYNSDREYLKRMQVQFDVVKSAEKTKLEKSDNKSPSKSTNSKSVVSKNKPKYLETKTSSSKDENNSTVNNFKSELLSIQYSISEIKKRDSKIKDNLELLLLSHEGSFQITTDKSNLFGPFSNLTKNSNANLFSLLKNNPISKKFSKFWF